jgi:hypothetical protein
LIPAFRRKRFLWWMLMLGMCLLPAYPSEQTPGVQWQFDTGG